MSRRAREMSSEQKAVVSTVRRIAKQRSRVSANYVSAILRARDEGITYAAIADAAGTSSQAVQEIVRRHKRKDEARPGSLGVAGDIVSISTDEVSHANTADQGPSNPVA